MMQKKLLYFFIFLLNITTQSQKTQKILLSPEHWEFSEKSSYKYEQFKDRNSLYLNGRATFKNFSFYNGTLEVDIYASDKRSFAGIFFRHKKETAEEVYMRMHKSAQPDAVQYTPIYNNEGSWQLYPEHQAKIVFKKKGWNTLKIEVTNNQAKVFINNKPALTIPNLKTGIKFGSIGLWTLFGNRFSNFRYSEKIIFTPKYTYPTPVADITNYITKWGVSNPFTYKGEEFINTKQFTNKTYTNFPTDATGLLPIGKYIAKPSKGNFEKNNEDYIIAKVVLTSKKKQQKKIYFDYSDKVIFYLNKQKIYVGNNAFRSKGNKHKGHLNVNANTLLLPLNKGDNTLYIVVIEKANGWGLISKFENKDNIQLK